MTGRALASRFGRPLGCFAAAVSLAGCMATSSPGLELDVHLAHGAPDDPAAEAPLLFEASNGEPVAVRQAYVVPSSLELVPCASDALAEAIGGAIVSVARAHSEASPTRLGTPVVFDVASGESRDVAWGTLRPPPRRYCALRFGVLPADADAVGMPADASLEGLSSRVAGVQGPPGEEVPFVFETSLAFDVNLPVDAARLETAEPVTVRVEVTALDWFADVDFSSMDDDEIARAVLTHIRDGIIVRYE